VAAAAQAAASIQRPMMRVVNCFKITPCDR
jgi:hypothetical protein